jgi:hypothetical protein
MKPTKVIATKEVNKAIEPMFQQGQQVDEANDATANKTNEAIDSDNEDGVLDNQLAELEKLDAANEAVVSDVAIEANAANEAHMANEADKADDAIETVKVIKAN